jgi:hypothetical protein
MAVGRLAVGGGNGDPMVFATGFIVEPGWLVTCNHVLNTPEEAKLSRLHLDFFEADDGRIPKINEIPILPESLFITSKETDLTIVGLPQNLGISNRAIPLPIGEGKVAVHDTIYLIHHSLGEPLKVSIGNILKDSESFFFHSCSTRSGSAGSPVFNDQGCLLGIHHSAKRCRDAGPVNEAISYSCLLSLLDKLEDISLPAKIGKKSAHTRRSPMNLSPTIPLKEESVVRDSVFISYAHADQEHENWKDRVLLQLRSIDAIGETRIWDDSRIEAGDDWLKEIEYALKRTMIAILLIGPHFLTSKFVQTKELPEILEAAKNDGAKILPLVTDYAAYKHSRLKRFQTINDPDKPLESLKRSEQNRILLEVAVKVADLMEAK